MDRKTLGDCGEIWAKNHLREQGYDIWEEKLRLGRGEVDIVAAKGEYVVFVEVKTRRGDKFGKPIEGISEGQCRRIIDVARSYMVQYPNMSARFDVVEVEAVPNGARFEVVSGNHIENAFW